MEMEDYFNPTNPNDVDNLDVSNALTNALREDKGLNIISRMVPNKYGDMVRKNIRVFTSNGTGTKIRDAETGEYFQNKVGSNDEELFYKVALATGECKTGSNVLFYCSPQHYMNHLHCEETPENIDAWERRRNARLDIINAKRNHSVINSIVVK